MMRVETDMQELKQNYIDDTRVEDHFVIESEILAKYKTV